MLLQRKSKNTEKKSSKRTRKSKVVKPSEDEGLEIAQEPPETSETEELGEAVESEEEEAENREEKAVAYKRYFRTPGYYT